MRGDKYTAYTKDETSEAVAALFEQKHGYSPLEVLDGKTVWLAGPLGENGKSLVARAEAEYREITPERARQLVIEWEVT